MDDKIKSRDILKPNQTVVVVEDLISTGKSSLMAVDALRETKANVKGMVAIFTYGFDIAESNFENKNVVLHTLSDYANLLLKAESTNYISSSEAALLSEWRIDPANWDPKPITKK